MNTHRQMQIGAQKVGMLRCTKTNVLPVCRQVRRLSFVFEFEKLGTTHAYILLDISSQHLKKGGKE